MTAALKRPIDKTDFRVPARDQSVAAALMRLRVHALTCRASAFLDIYEACALIDLRATLSETVGAVTLLRVLGQALMRTPRLLNPGEAARSFDEEWLVALLTAHKEGDDDSFAFLIASRVARPKQRIVAMLVRHWAQSAS